MSTPPASRLVALLRRLVIGVGLLVLFAALASAELPVVSPVALFLLIAGLVGLLLWATIRILRRLLWRVGRRLAFSYFLIGVLPIPMLALLAGLSGYLLAGFFLSHVYRDAVRAVEVDLGHAAALALESHIRGAATNQANPAETAATTGIAVALYRDGIKIDGDARAPASWPEWIPHLASTSPPDLTAAAPLPLAGFADGTVTAVAGTRASFRGEALAALAFTTADLADELTRRSGLWVELGRAGETEQRTVTVQVFGASSRLMIDTPARDPEGRTKFFAKAAASERWLDSPFVFWAEEHKPLRYLSDGTVASDSVDATLNTTPRVVAGRVFSQSAEVDTTAWAALFGASVLLLEIYLGAVVMAVFMIFSLSRAVNRLHRATTALQAGDFTMRIPVKRKDQLGELQRSFNRLAENLEALVQTAAQKEVLETELGMARELQRSLLPPEHLADVENPTGPWALAAISAASPDNSGAGEPPAGPRSQILAIPPELRRRGAVWRDAAEEARFAAAAPTAGQHTAAQRRLSPFRFATHFAPSAAIGGDYFDILHLPDRRVAVVIADVSGHGLSSGLRMAMIKAALNVLVDEGHPPQTIFEKLDGVVRKSGDTRSFVTATLGFLDPDSGQLELINAGHPPTYIVHRGVAREIVLPSAPLGAMGHRYGRATVQLAPNDVVVWLSDGLVEACNNSEEPFGYERVLLTLSGAPASSSATRDRLLHAVHAWTGEGVGDDDQTLVVMRWVGPPEGH